MEIITTHKNSDFDAVASVFAATLIYKEALAVLPKSLNPNVKAFISLHKDLFVFKTPGEVDVAAVSRLVAVDAPRWSRLEGLTESSGTKRIWISISGTIMRGPGDSCASKAVIEKVGATVTLLVRQLERNQTPVTPIQATLFLAGIYEDTGSMSFPPPPPRMQGPSPFCWRRGATSSYFKISSAPPTVRNRRICSIKYSRPPKGKNWMISPSASAWWKSRDTCRGFPWWLTWFGTS
jgi:hypothetical protein